MRVRTRLEHARGVCARPPSLVVRSGTISALVLSSRMCKNSQDSGLRAAYRLTPFQCFSCGSPVPLLVSDARWCRRDLFPSEHAESCFPMTQPSPPLGKFDMSVRQSALDRAVGQNRTVL